MFIDFEGIDGSGKTTLSNMLADRLRKLGYRVTHAREGGELQAPIARRLRELTRDPSYLEMGARTELLLNLARDAQQLEEVVKPALARGELCITDRYVYSQITHSGAGRGLPPAEVQAAAAFAAQGVWPDLVVLVDVDPELARLRKRAGRRGDDETRASSRKGLVGAGITHRIRKAFHELARTDPSRWVILLNEDVPLKALAQNLCDLVVARLEGGAPEIRPLNARPPVRRGVGLGGLEEAFFEAVDELAIREPYLALFSLTGIPGPAAHQRRVRLLESYPKDVARSLTGLGDEESHRIREILLALAPKEVAQSLWRDLSAPALALRERLFDAAPAQVVQTLKGCDGARAWALRERALAQGEWISALLGLVGVDSPRAWEVREAGLRHGLSAEVARSLGELHTPQADAWRERLLDAVPLAVLKGLSGVDSPFARRAREALFPRAPKPVLRSLAGVDAPYAWAMRVRAAPLTKEALDAVDGMDAEEAWQMRNRWAAQWPCTALSSLRDLAMTPRGQALVERVLAENPGRVPVWRSAYSVIARAQGARPAPAGRDLEGEGEGLGDTAEVLH